MATWKDKFLLKNKKAGYNTRYDSYCELKAVWIDMADMCKFITSKLIDDNYFTVERIEQLKRILTKMENTGIDEFIKESEIEEVF